MLTHQRDASARRDDRLDATPRGTVVKSPFARKPLCASSASKIRRDAERIEAKLDDLLLIEPRREKALPRSQRRSLEGD